jgi:hypothetical protein
MRKKTKGKNLKKTKIQSRKKEKITEKDMAGTLGMMSKSI